MLEELFTNKKLVISYFVCDMILWKGWTLIGDDFLPICFFADVLYFIALLWGIYIESGYRKVSIGSILGLVDWIWHLVTMVYIVTDMNQKSEVPFSGLFSGLLLVSVIPLTKLIVLAIFLEVKRRSEK